MKKLLVLVSVAFSIVATSQSDDKMKFINFNQIEYKGETIKVKEAKRIAKENNPLAFKQFKRAQLFRGLAITADVLWIASEIFAYTIRKDNEENNVVSSAQEAFDRGYNEAFVEGVTWSTFSTGLLCSSVRINFIFLGVNAFNEGK